MALSMVNIGGLKAIKEDRSVAFWGKRTWGGKNPPHLEENVSNHVQQIFLA